MGDLVIFTYPDGRNGETGLEGFKANHEPFGAKITAYVGADGKDYSPDDEGRKLASKAIDMRQSVLSAEVAERQAAEKPFTPPITNVSMRPKAEKAPPKDKE